MKHKAQALIPAILTIFFVFLAVVSNLITFAPYMTEHANLDLVLTSLNETVKGCFAYATSKDWENYLYQLNLGGEDREVKSGKEIFQTCITTTSKYIEKLYNYNVIFNSQDAIYVSGPVSSYVTSVEIRKGHSLVSATSFSSSISINLDSEGTVVEISPPNASLLLKFTADGFISGIVNYVIYICDENYCEEVMLGKSLPMEENMYLVRVGISPVYLALGKVNVLMKCSDLTGATVWVSLSIDLRSQKV